MELPGLELDDLDKRLFMNSSELCAVLVLNHSRGRQGAGKAIGFLNVKTAAATRWIYMPVSCVLLAFWSFSRRTMNIFPLLFPFALSSFFSDPRRLLLLRRVVVRRPSACLLAEHNVCVPQYEWLCGASPEVNPNRGSLADRIPRRVSRHSIRAELCGLCA